MLLQTYESAVSDRDSGHLLYIMTIPANALPDRQVLGDVVRSMRALGIDPHCSITAQRLAHGITAVLDISGPGDVRINDLDRLVQEQPAAFSFAQRIAQEAEIPWVASPLEGASLVALASVGAGLGYALAAGGGPVLLITVPAGIVVVFVAVAVAEVLREVIHKKGRSAGDRWGSRQRESPIDPDATFPTG